MTNQTEDDVETFRVKIGFEFLVKAESVDEARRKAPSFAEGYVEKFGITSKDVDFVTDAPYIFGEEKRSLW